MQSAFIHYKSSVIYASRFGNGNKTVICFHGYGETCGSFRFFENQTENEFTFLAIDLPFHGQTEWNEGLNFTINDLAVIIKSAIEKLTNHGQDEDHKITLLGYSLGGRIALSLYQYDPDKTDKVVLLAPDGLKVNFWYWLSTQTIIGNSLFSFTMRYPAWFFVMLKALNKLHLVNQSIFKFVNYYIGEAQVRKDLYQRWTCLRKLKPDLRSIKSQIRNFRTPFRIIYGKHDRIIIPRPGINFSKGIEEFCQIAEIHSGHQVLHEKHIKEILPVLLQ